MMLIAQLAHAAQLTQVLLAADDEQQAAETMGIGFADSFWVVAVLAIAVFLLGFDLVRRLRRAKNKAEIQAEIANELAAREAENGSGTSADGGSPADGGQPETGEADPRSQNGPIA